MYHLVQQCYTEHDNLTTPQIISKNLNEWQRKKAIIHPDDKNGSGYANIARKVIKSSTKIDNNIPFPSKDNETEAA